MSRAKGPTDMTTDRLMKRALTVVALGLCGFGCTVNVSDPTNTEPEPAATSDLAPDVPASEFSLSADDCEMFAEMTLLYGPDGAAERILDVILKTAEADGLSADVAYDAAEILVNAMERDC